MKKTTLHGVSSKATKDMFLDLKKRGFTVSLEKGSKGTFKILSFINGVEFVISCMDGVCSKYTKGYARNKRSWVKFNSVDDLLLSSMVKKDNQPTDKQKVFFSGLISDLSKLSKAKVKIKPPLNVVDMVGAISEAILAKQELKKDNLYKVKGIFITTV